MELKILLLLVVFACVQVDVVTGRKRPVRKPGQCPVSTIVTACDCRPEYLECDGDQECPGNKKCCSYGCGCRRHCVKPKKAPQKGPSKRVCSLPKVTGPCKANMRRWWFNKATNRCERFTYGGCRGNKNNFTTRKACRQRCP
ncbi:eppin-like [Ostrea edulis]|uniref:eppin-like n=1 Tax=Ostrea edulis TaxID=37623 RepID=UPI002094A1DA|nr:eppin-like [Ostrea edulis]